MATEAPAALEPTQVQAFVGNAHGDLEAVRAALAGEPRLVNAAWDWGGGDWETALGEGATAEPLRRVRRGGRPPRALAASAANDLVRRTRRA